jgi:uncharacterized Tic20 family protein
MITTPIFIIIWGYNPKMIARFLIHSVPIISLSIEYFVNSQVPFLKRHFFGITMPLVVILLLVQMLLAWFDEPVVPQITYKGELGFIVPLSVLILSCMIFACCDLASRIKLKHRGHQGIYQITDEEISTQDAET